MKFERTKNASRNIVYGVLLRVYQIAVPFLMRTVMIYCLGMEYLGLNSLFTSILQILNLAELGVGSAMTYSMYKPIAEDDKSKIRALMQLYKVYYRIIGLVVLAIGVVFIPFLPKLIKGSVPDGVSIYILYLLNLGATVLSYWLFAYKNCLLVAHQRTDITSKITMVLDTIKYLLQVGCLVVIKSYYLYLIIALLSQILTNIVTAIVVTRIYPKYKAEGKLEKSEVRIINGKVKDLFTAKLGMVIINSADSVVISAFLGLEMLAIYQNYYFILTAIIGIVGTIFLSCVAGIGNSIITESKEKNYNDLKKFTFIIIWISGICSCCLLGLYQPFMELWVGKDNKLGFSVVICFVIYYFIYEINQLLNLYKDAAGLWHEDRFRPLITAVSNLIMNLILVQYIGIYGVLLSTVLTMVGIGMPWLLYNLFTVLFKMKPWSYIRSLAKYVAIVLISVVISYSIADFIKEVSVFTFIVKGVICTIVPNSIYFIFFRKTEEFRQMIQLGKKIIKK